jgi:hypothetical protein
MRLLPLLPLCLLVLLVAAWPAAAAADDVAAVTPATAEPDPLRVTPGAAPAHPEPDAAGRRLRATRRRADIRIDGRLDDPGWQQVPVTGDFVQRFPHDGAAPSHATEFRVVYDDQAIYVGVRAHDSAPAEIRSLLTRRDQASASDSILVGLDTYGDRRTAFVFGINPAGVQRDLLIFDDTQSDDSWDAVWSGAAAIDDQGWTAELRIPLSQLRFSAGDRQRWGLQVVRTVGRSREESAWSPWPRTSSQVVSRFGVLEGIAGLRPGRRLELLPYVTSGLAMAAVDPGDPFAAAVAGRLDVGLDLKYGLSSAFTLAAAVNPDFGQVEADPSHVNLSALEIFLPEKRPFFLEGTDIFRFGLQQGNGAGEGLFYTRRIGAPPHLDGRAAATYADQPAATTIYGAAKISGKTEGGWSIGVLEAVTAEERATLAEPDGAREALVVEPLSNYAVVRVLRTLREGRSTVAGVVTSVHRHLETPELAARLHDQAYSGGVDASHRFGGERWGTSAKLYGSWVHGSPEALLYDQTRIRHLYQRPDAHHLTLDPTRTSLAGAGLLWDLGRWNHPRWNFGAGGDVRSAGLELNDLGFQHGADFAVQWLWLGYRDQVPSAQVVSWGAEGSVFAAADTSPLLTGAGGNVSAYVTLANYWNLAGGGNLNHNRWDVAALRGGPRLRAEDAWSVWGNLSSDGRKRVSAGSSAWLSRRPASDSWRASLGAWVWIQARSNLEVRLGPELSTGVEDRQYVATLEDPAGAPAYLFARLDQVTAAMTVRAGWTFSPRLSLQLYAQPFLASGGYRALKLAADTYARDYAGRFDVLGPDRVREVEGTYQIDRDGDGVADLALGRPDFTVRQLRSNLVLRWEYRPGSAVFLIWSHGRSGFDDDGRLRPGHDLAELGRERGEHVVMVKANYWMGL